jgi:cytochrome c oxidase subunit 2
LSQIKVSTQECNLKDFVQASVIWIALTAILEVVVYLFHEKLYPPKGSEQAYIVDEAFSVLLYLAVPIVTLVLTMVCYSVIRSHFRAKNNNDKQSDAVGESARFHKKWGWSWLAWSSALCIAVIIFPGYIGLMELRSTNSEPADVTIQVTGMRWAWWYYYEDQEISLKLSDDVLVLPNDSLIRFKIRVIETDVLHSFWIPAFRTKIDAVPGLLTGMDVSTNRIGSFEDDSSYRVQCAELCGINHSKMNTNVKVVSKEDFDLWVASQKEAK